MSHLGVRLRQVVLAASDLDAVAGALREQLGLGEPYVDPGVGEFGLRNAVFALGDAFIEVVSPTREGTAAGRWLERHGGDGGYMLIFQLDDLPAARARADALGIRTVWSIDLPDISGTHLHPGDMRGTIVSLDRAEPPGSWRWGGPDWTGRAGTGAPGRLLGTSVGVPEAEAVAARWAQVLGVTAQDGTTLAVDGGEVRLVLAPRDEGLVEIAVALPAEVRADRTEAEIGGVRFRMEEER